MSAGAAVARGAGKVALSVVGDVRFALVLAVGVGAGIWLGRYWWAKWEKGLLHPPLIGHNPDRLQRQPVNVVTGPMPGPGNGGVRR